MYSTRLSDADLALIQREPGAYFAKRSSYDIGVYVCFCADSRVIAGIKVDQPTGGWHTITTDETYRSTLEHIVSVAAQFTAVIITTHPFSITPRNIEEHAREQCARLLRGEKCYGWT